MEKINYKGFTITIDTDEVTTDPREWDAVGTIYSNHRDYSPDDHSIKELMGKYDVDCMADLTEKLTENKVPFVPIYAYIHSGISLSTSDDKYPFNDRWDSGLFGLIVGDKEKFDECFDGGDIKKYLRDQVELLNKYYNNDFYRFEVEDDEGDTMDCCGGYCSEEDALSDAKESVDEWYEDNKNTIGNPSIPTDELKRVFFEYVTSSPQWGRDLMEKVNEKTLRTFLKEQLKEMLTEDVIQKEFEEWLS